MPTKPLIVLLCLALSPGLSLAEDDPDSERDDFGQGGVSVTTSAGSENAPINAADDESERLAPSSLGDTLLFLGLGVQLQGAALAEQLGFDPDEFADKFRRAPPEVQQAGFQAILLDSEVSGVGFLGTLAVLAFTDPVYAFDFTYRNDSDVEQTVEYQMPLNVDPTPFVNDTTPARSYLEVELLDANDDGDASLGFAPGAAGGFLSTNVTIDGFDSAFLVDDQGDGFFDLGEELTAPTVAAQIDDTGDAFLRSFASDPEFVTEISPALRFVISPGDEARFRGVVSVAESGALLADPLLALGVLENGFVGDEIPEPATAVLLMVGWAAVGARRAR